MWHGTLLVHAFSALTQFCCVSKQYVPPPWGSAVGMAPVKLPPTDGSNVHTVEFTVVADAPGMSAGHTMVWPLPAAWPVAQRSVRSVQFMAALKVPLKVLLGLHALGAFMQWS
jgi:hypothetical protein